MKLGGLPVEERAGHSVPSLALGGSPMGPWAFSASYW